MRTIDITASLAVAFGLLLVGCQKPPTSSDGVVTSDPPAVVSTVTPLAEITPSALPTDATTPSGQTSPAADGTPAALGTPIKTELKPLPAKADQAPVITKKTTVVMSTNAGEVTIEVYPEAAPNAAQRFIELAESGYYNDTPVSRVVKTPAPFVAQFGINWRAPHKAWQNKNFQDDPSLFSLDRGTIAFAKKGPDTNSTQVFINYGDNSHLADPSMNFTTFGKVTKGMEVVDSFLSVGDAGEGLDQMRLWDDGGNYLESLTTKPTMIEKMTVVK